MNEKLAKKDIDQEELSKDPVEAPEENSEQQVTDEEEKSEEEDSPEKKILEEFDKALTDYMERLLGTNLIIGELPINICTFSCISLIAARETEIESFPYLPPERYTNEKIAEELAGIGIEPGEDLDATIEAMIDKEYMEVADDGRFFAKPPTISMSKLIDRIFPKMPGLNLFAYMGQMMEEVLAERKSIDYAIDQFKQIMEIHGTPITSAPSEKKSEKKLYPHLKVPSDPTSTEKTKVIPSFPDIKPSDIFSQLETKTLKTPLRPEGLDVQNDKPRQDTPSVEQEDSLVSDELTATEKADSGEKVEITADRSFEEHESKGETFEKDGSSDLDIKDAVEQLEDDDIEKRISAFEEQLGIKCPLCHTPGIRSQVTTKGKTYYSCSNNECNFISWGKPYYITCPQCNNPFLVEAKRDENMSMLKCPRPTCPHWQKFPWEEALESTEEDPGSAGKDDNKPKKRRRVKRRKVVVRRRR